MAFSNGQTESICGAMRLFVALKAEPSNNGVAKANSTESIPDFKLRLVGIKELFFKYVCVCCQ